jgi:hypothetical protein
MAMGNPAPVPQPDPKAGYDASEETAEEWLRAMAGKDQEWKNIGTDEKPAWLLATKCPRCGHATSNRIQPMVILRLRGSLGAQQSEVYVECNCSSPHTGHPGEAIGCGPAGYIGWPPTVTRPR